MGYDKHKDQIDLVQGIVEAEGTEEFVKFIYADYKDALKQNGSFSQASELPKGHAKKATKVIPGTQPANDSPAKKKKGGSGRGVSSPVKETVLKENFRRF